MQQSTWSDLPLDILLEVYCLLPCQDRFNMSLTCKNWLLPFLNAKIWRHTQFHVTCHTIRHKRRIPESVIKALRYLSLDFSASDSRKASSLPKMVEFLTSLERSENNSLEYLSFVDWSDSDDTDALTLMTSVVTSQNHLKCLKIVDIESETDFITVVLIAVSQNCADTLEQLEVKSSMDYKMLQLPKVFSRLKKLTELSISCDFLSDVVLSNLPGTLKVIKVWNSQDYFSYFETATLSLAWATLATKVPTLKVEYHFLDMEEDDWSLMEILPQEVPLTSVYWKYSKRPLGFKRTELQSTTDSCIEYIMDTFQNLLELHITVCFDLFSEQRVATTVERFRQLETLTICQTLGNKHFDLKQLEEALRDMLDRDLVRGQIKTSITVNNVYKSRTDVFTVREWVCVLDSQAH